MISTGKHDADSNMFKDGAFIWNGGSTAKLWTTEGDIQLTGVKKLDDGTLIATGGKGKFGNWYGNLKDLNGDGRVLTIKPSTDGATHDFSLDVDKGKVVTGTIDKDTIH